jgi:hypothetical protein
MARIANAVETVPLHLSTTPQVKELLDLLAQTGRFGKNGSEVGEELLRAKLREVELEGWLERPGLARSAGRRRATRARR